MPPPTFLQIVTSITDKRQNKIATFNSMAVAQESIRLAKLNLDFALEHSLPTQDFQDAYDLHLANYNTLNTAYQQLKLDEATLLSQYFATYNTQQNAVAQLSDSTPILFFPVKLETVFKDLGGSYELWVRIFPDEIFIDTHEDQLTQDEIEQGKQYWMSRFGLTGTTTDVTKVQAWDLLSRSYGAQRAAWVALKTTPTSGSTSSTLAFPTLIPKSSSWTKQPFSRILPDAFVINCYTGSSHASPDYSVKTNNIPDEVKVGFDPSSNNPSFTQLGGEVIADSAADVEWMIKFDAAITKGLAVKIPISLQDYNGGFDRIVALGVKATLTKEAGQTRVQDLIKNHHYTDGFSLLKQGTCTSNTDGGNSGYSSIDYGSQTTYSIECEADLFSPVNYARSKPDGQILCEALGIDYDPLYHIFQSNGYDIRNAMNINNVLWMSAFGYYATTMLSADVDSATADQTREFYTNYVRSRGALPSIRSGIQPYGILPTSVMSRLSWTSGTVNAVLYDNIRNFSGALSAIWSDAVVQIEQTFNSAQSEDASQIFLDVLSQNPVSVERVQRMGVGPGYVWNNLVLNQQAGAMQEWSQLQQNRMGALQSSSGLPISDNSRILQMSFLPNHSSISKPLIADPSIDPNGPLPEIEGSGLNYLQVLSQATFIQLRDENYAGMGIGVSIISDALLYKFSRNSLMLEYLDAAYKILGTSQAGRVEPEFINLVDGTPFGEETDTPLSYGGSRWSTLMTSYGGYDTIADYLDSGVAEALPETVNLFLAKDGLEAISALSIRDLGLLTAEVIDASSIRLDSWRLALVNQRLNTIRGITEGSSTRTMGIYLGAYGWLENIRKSSRTAGTNPNANSFSGTMYSDPNNQGYIHAPSLNQAAAAAVLRSGYNTRASSSTNTPLSVNISSERVRSAMDILDGIRNGQELSVLLGYEFERYMFEGNLYTTAIPYLDPYIDDLRTAYALKNTITQYGANSVTNPIPPPNVLDGQQLIDDYKVHLLNAGTMISSNVKISLTFPFEVESAVGKSIDWIMNVIDAVGDLTTAESVYQLVKGNKGNSGAVAEAISKGTYVPQIEVIDTPKTGLSVNQRFTMHFEVNSARASGWDTASTPITARSAAEPYLNRWIGQILGDPTLIQCWVDSDVPTSDATITLAQLKIQPIDLLFIANDEFNNDASEMALRIRRVYRSNNTTVNKAAFITIDFNGSTVQSKPANVISFEELLPVLKYLRNLLTSCRSLKTTDYISPTSAGGVTNLFAASELATRLANAVAALEGSIQALINADNVLTSYTQSTEMENVRLALSDLGGFGVEQTIYEYPDNTLEDYDAIKSIVSAVLSVAEKRIAEYYKIFPPPPNTRVLPTDPDELIKLYVDTLKIVFGNAFIALPRFQLRQQESGIYDDIMDATTAPYDDFLKDHLGNDFLLDEWISGVAKVRKNTANYELLSILASAINLDSFTSDRKVVPLQIPFAPDGTERWLGASVDDPEKALKEGRVSFGVSLPNIPNYSLDGDQVGILIDEWMDVIPNKKETTGIAFHANQPNAKPPQCLLLGLAPQITGNWQWTDLVDMVNETFDLAKARSVTYDMISGTAAGHLLPTFMASVTAHNTTIGLTPFDIS